MYKRKNNFKHHQYMNMSKRSANAQGQGRDMGDDMGDDMDNDMDDDMGDDNKIVET
jgi:hypothetical protein